MTVILGISAYYHDSAAALIMDGRVVAAAQEERFSRKKHDARFPRDAILYCLNEAGLKLMDVTHVVFYDKPLLKFERLLETYLSYAPRGFRSFSMAMPVWLKEKLLLKSVLRRELKALTDKDVDLPPLLFTEHHQSHAASAFFPSPFERAAVLCLDGVGEWATTSVWQGEGSQLTPLWELHFPHSLGLLYSAFTYYCGFKVNSGEYKLMGLAPYGQPKYVDQIYKNLIDVKGDGTFKLNMEYFNYPVGLTMTTARFHALFGGGPRAPESELTQKEMDLACSIQRVTEDIVLKITDTIYHETGNTDLCLAGGVALNCVANGRIVRESKFNRVWVQPAAGDAGGSLGAALQVWHEYYSKGEGQDLNENKSQQPNKADAMQGSYLGPSFSQDQITTTLDELEANYMLVSEGDLYQSVAKLIGKGNVVGWFQGRMEFGPRALGNRSILADPRDSKMQSLVNLKIKFRESFRPFAPAVLAEYTDQIFDHQGDSPYMAFVAKLKQSQLISSSTNSESANTLTSAERLAKPRSRLPAITHIDCSARLQTVHAESNPRFHRLLSAFNELTACPVLINTSFNVRGEPIVNTPNDAYRCFMRTEMDYLVLGNAILAKADQPANVSDVGWQTEFELD